MNGIILLLAISSCGLSESNPAVCRIVGFQGGGYGSGFLILKTQYYGYVLTTAHGAPVPQYYCVFGDLWYEAEIIYKDRAVDLTLLRIMPPKEDPIPPSRGPPEKGEALTWWGFAGRPPGKLYFGKGTYVGLGRSCGPIRQTAAHCNGTTFMPGQSGGPVLNKDGEFFGACHARCERHRDNEVVPRDAIAPFLDKCWRVVFPWKYK